MSPDAPQSPEPTKRGPKPGRKRLSQTDVPSLGIHEVLRLPNALRDECGSQPTAPLLVAKALGMQPSSGSFRALAGAAAAYGLTNGAAQGATISLTDLGRRVVSPTVEGDRHAALREAVMRPRVNRQFLQKYDGQRFPAPAIALNVLTEQLNVPSEAAEKALEIIRASAQAVGYLENVQGNLYVHLGANVANAPEPSPAGTGAHHSLPTDPVDPGGHPPDGQLPDGRPSSEPVQDLTSNRRVFISHGKNREVVGQLQEVLKFGGFEAVVSVYTDSTAMPVPDKVMDDMRSCGAGIVHVGAERTLLDANGNEHTVLNPNVLIEIGAALALYKRNFILLVENGVDLPSNLQGLTVVSYDGGKLDYEATMTLLRTFNKFRSS